MKDTKYTHYFIPNLALPLPKRPGFGTVGRRIKLYGNFYDMRIPTNAIIHHYDVTIASGKDIDKLPKAVGRRLIEMFVNSNKKLFKTRPVFDGKKNMYVKQPLDFQGSVSLVDSFFFCC